MLIQSIFYNIEKSYYIMRDVTVVVLKSVDNYDINVKLFY